MILKNYIKDILGKFPKYTITCCMFQTTLQRFLVILFQIIIWFFDWLIRQFYKLVYLYSNFRPKISRKLELETLFSDSATRSNSPCYRITWFVKLKLTRQNEVNKILLWLGWKFHFHNQVFLLLTVFFL